MTIKLPTEKTKASRINPKILVLYGQPKVGKTEALSNLDDCLILDLEDGSDPFDALKIKVNSLKELNEAIIAIRDANKPYKYVAIDTVSKMEEWCEIWGTEMYKASPVGKNFKGDSVLTLPDGNGYQWLRIAFNKAIGAIYPIADHIILVGHLREKNLDKEDKGVSAADLALMGKDRLIACSKADAIGLLYRKFRELDANKKPIHDLWVSFLNGTENLAGARQEHLRGADFKFDWNKIYLPEEPKNNVISLKK